MTFKDETFNETTVTRLANDIVSVYPSFDVDTFIKDCLDGFPPRELKERITHVEKMLEKHLTPSYIKNIEILSEAMSHVKGGGFIYASVIEYVESQGCTEEYLDLSLEKLGEFTRLLSSEFSIRKFFNTFEDATLKKVYEWTKSDDVHRRRLATEGTRPRLPWAPNINVDYKKTAKVLDHLFYDTERYVTRSCANHLNDISKFDPEFVLKTLQKWKDSNKQNEQEMNYIIKHSLRTLVKQGHLDTLVFLGLDLHPDIEVSEITLSNETPTIGDDLFITFSITPREDTKLIIDFIIYYLLKNGSLSKKVYKVVTVEAKENQTLHYTRKRHLNQMTTRKLNPGVHKVELQINGTTYATKDFELKN